MLRVIQALGQKLNLELIRAVYGQSGKLLYGCLASRRVEGAQSRARMRYDVHRDRALQCLIHLALSCCMYKH